MRYELVTAGTFNAITLDQAREHLQIPSNITAKDDLIKDYLEEITAYIEDRTKYVVSSSTWAGWLDCWPDNDIIRINRYPISAIASVQYYDPDGVLQTLSSTNYTTDLVGKVARIYLSSTPSIDDRVNAIKVNFTAGYSSIAAVEPRLKKITRLLLTDADMDRGSYVKGTMVSALPKGAESYINQLKIEQF